MCIGGYSGYGLREELQLHMREEQQLHMREEQLHMREYNEKIVNNRHRSRSAPLGSHELFHRRVHPDHTRTRPCDVTSDSLPEGSFMLPVNRYQATDLLLPKLARSTPPTSLEAPQPPKVAFVDTTMGIGLEENNTTPPCPHLLSFCHYCGRSSGIRLAWCLHCQNAVYCSQSCRQSHWDEGHKTECSDPNSFKTHKRCEYSGCIHNATSHKYNHVEVVFPYKVKLFTLTLVAFSIVFIIHKRFHTILFHVFIALSLKTSKLTNSAKGSRGRPKSVPVNSQLPYISNTKTHQRR